MAQEETQLFAILHHLNITMPEDAKPVIPTKILLILLTNYGNKALFFKWKLQSNISR